MIDTEEEKKFDREHVWLHLDPDLYYNDTTMTRYALLTTEQYMKVRKWTLENMKKCDKASGRKGFVDSDYEKLEA